MKTTLVLGASLKSDRYSNKAILSLLKNGFKVIAVGNKEGITHGLNITKHIPLETNSIDTITLYINAKNQIPYFDHILRLNPRRIIFNPGTENREFARIANVNGIEVIEGCTLVMLTLKNY
jgi:predicted CoA-binding protein